MTGARARQWFWSLVRFAIAATLVAFAAGALHYVLLTDPVVGAITTLQHLLPTRKAPASGDQRPFPDIDNGRSSITVDVSPDMLRGSYTFLLPKHDPLFLQLQHKIADLDMRRVPGTVLDRYVGFVGFGRKSAIEADTARFMLDPKSPDAVITGTLTETDIPEDEIVQHSLLVTINPPWQLRSGECEAIFRGRGVDLYPLGSAPNAQSVDGREVVLHFNFKPGGRGVRVLAVLPDAQQAPSQSIGGFIRGISGGYLEGFQPLLYGCLNALPFILFIFVFRNRLDEHRPFFSLAVWFAYLYLTLGVLRAVIELFWIGSRTFRETYLGYPSLDLEGIGALSLVFVAWIWPWRVARLGRLRGSELLDRLAPPFNARRMIACFVAFGAMLLVIVEEIRKCSSLHWWETQTVATSWPWLVTISVALLASLTWLALELDGKRGAVLEVIAGFEAVIVYFVYQELSPVMRPLRIAGLWLFALPFALATGYLFDVRKWRRFTVPIIAAAVLFLVWLREGDTISPWWVVTSVAWELAQPLTILLLAALVWILYSLSKNDEWTKLEKAERDAGTVLVLIVLQLSSRSWLSVPILLGAGALILNRWLFANETVAAPGDDDVGTIRDLIRYNDAQRALRQLKQELAKSVGGGTMSFHDYRMRVDGLEAYIDELAKKVGGINAPRSALLSSGTPKKPWDRAVLAAQYAFLAATPWMAVFVYNTASGPTPDHGYLWLPLAATAIFGIAQWPLYGFFLGYFYQHIRGYSGVSKGLSLFILFALPALIATAVTMPLDSDAWTSLTFWALQLFVQVLIVGMFAGDLETLHSSGLGWRHLLDVHDLGSMTAYASTVIAAIGAAVATFLAAQVPTVLTWTMQYFNAQGPPK
jgi:hypothetical protein